MASKKVNIQIDTRANTSGAKQVEVAVDKMVDSVDEAEAAVVDLSVAVDKLDTKLIDVDRSATEVERAVDKLDTTLDVAQSTGKETAQSIEAVAQASDKAAVASKKQEAGTSRVGQVASQAGFQLQDFAVQVAGGTSALTAMAQQAPQFLGVFGPGGAIAGALIAVGAVATKVFMSMRDDAADTITSTETLSDAIQQIGENAAKAVSKEIDFGLAQIDAAAEQARALAGAFDGVTDAANAAALASLTNAEKLREAEIEIRKLRGEQVDEMGNIAANAASEAAIREEQARQEIEAQNQRLAKAKEESAAAEVLKLQKESMRIEGERQLRDANALVAALRAQRDELEKQAKAKGSFSKGEIPFIGAPLAAEAQRQLEDPAFQTLLETAEKKASELEKALAKGGSLMTGVTSAMAALERKVIEEQAVAEEIAITIPEIEKSYQTQNIVAQVEAIKEVSSQAATDVQGVIDTVKPANAAEAAALEQLKPMVADKQITADETLRVSQLLRTLDGAIRTQMGTSATNTQKLIDTISTMQRTLDAQSKQIQRLQSQARSSGN